MSFTIISKYRFTLQLNEKKNNTFYTKGPVFIPSRAKDIFYRPIRDHSAASLGGWRGWGVGGGGVQL